MVNFCGNQPVIWSEFPYFGLNFTNISLNTILATVSSFRLSCCCTGPSADHLTKDGLQIGLKSVCFVQISKVEFLPEISLYLVLITFFRSEFR